MSAIVMKPNNRDKPELEQTYKGVEVLFLPVVSAEIYFQTKEIRKCLCLGFLSLALLSSCLLLCKRRENGCKNIPSLIGSLSSRTSCISRVAMAALRYTKSG